MKDLDFDELDRAVNSLMTNVPKSDVPKPEDTENTLNLTPTISDKPTPSPVVPGGTIIKPAAASATPAVPAPATSSPSPSVAVPSRSPLASRRGGRFMDVVHPSSDMKTPTTVPKRSTVSRQGATITPSATAAQPSPAPASVPPSQPMGEAGEKEPPVVTTPSAPAPKPSVSEQAAPASDWPDPLELADFKNDNDTVKPEAPASKETAAPTDAEPKPEEKAKEDESSPLSSPFLSGTKVEKRPLGGAGASESTGEPGRAPAFGVETDTSMTVSDPEAQLPPSSPEEVEPELPEELKGDLMAIEADTTTHQHEKPEELAKLEPKEESKPSKKKAEPAPGDKPEPATMPTPTPPPHSDEKLLTAGPTSIPQQYREEPSSGDQDNGAIYDTDTYHQPLAHPAKQKPSWLWVVWIVAILLLGAAAGAGLYLLGVV